MSIRELRGVEKEEFLQAKWDYFSQFTKMVVFFGCLSSILFFVSDCQLFNRMAWETLLPRLYILLPLALYMCLTQKVKDYKILSVASLMMCHAIMWCTIGAIVYLPDRTHASEGFIIMNLLFFGVSFGTPFIMGSVMYAGMLINIFVTNLFLHYENIDIMYSLNIPCILGIIAASYALDSVYLDNFLMKKQLEITMVTDALTGCFNRHKLDFMIDNGCFNTEVGKPLCIIMLDIDFFKHVNDSYGHEGGDTVLKFISKTLNATVRKTDKIIRWGGEEFLIILTNCDLNRGVEIAERIRQGIEDGNSGICTVTVSMGIGKYEENTNYLDAIGDIDKALYIAKDTGRNRVVIYKDCDFYDIIEYTEKFKTVKEQ